MGKYTDSILVGLATLVFVVLWLVIKPGYTPLEVEEGAVIRPVSANNVFEEGEFVSEEDAAEDEAEATEGDDTEDTTDAEASAEGEEDAAEDEAEATEGDDTEDTTDEEATEDEEAVDEAA